MDKRGIDSTTIKILTRASNMICIIVLPVCLLIILIPGTTAAFEDLVSHSSVFDSQWFTIPMIFIALVVLVTLFALLRNFNMQKILKAQQDKNILGMPLEQYGADIRSAEETPAQDRGNHRFGKAMTQEALIKRLMDDNAAEIAKYARLARQALKTGKEDEAWIFVDKKQELEASRVSIKAEYAKIVNTRLSRASVGPGRQKDEAEILAEKYAAAARRAALEKERKSAVHTKASVDKELAKMKKDMGLQI